jgi:8-oxo-dGTP pyrophosphatase MutT (NUDIX family)
VSAPLGSPERAVVASRLGSFDRRSQPPGSGVEAAVAITVIDGADGTPSILLTLRADHLRAHGGQFALPGGRLDPGEDATDAARRELSEELGLEVGADRVLGSLDDFPTRSGYVITPVVLWAGSPGRPEPDPREVASVHEVPFHQLDRPGTPHFTATADPGRPLIEFPLLGTVVYAPTAAILYQFREVALRGADTRVAHLEQPRFAWE